MLELSSAMIISSLHNSSHPPEIEINPPKTACGYLCGGVTPTKHTHTHTHTHTHSSDTHTHTVTHTHTHTHTHTVTHTHTLRSPCETHLSTHTHTHTRSHTHSLHPVKRICQWIYTSVHYTYRAAPREFSRGTSCPTTAVTTSPREQHRESAGQQEQPDSD